MSSTPESQSGAATARRNRKVGTVVSARMQKSVVVEVTRFVRNARYGRIQKRTARFLVDDRVIGCRPGDIVEIEETRPLSARKRWRVRSVIKQGRGAVPEIAAEEPAS